MTRVAIVTGSAQGIGRAIALRLAHDGYDVAINDISANQPLAEAVAQEIRDMGQKSTVAIADVSRLSEVTHMIEHVVQELGPLTTMVANAGIAQVKPLLDLTEDDFERMFRVNVFGVQNCYQAAAKQIIKQGTATPESPAKLIGVCRSSYYTSHGHQSVEVTMLISCFLPVSSVLPLSDSNLLPFSRITAHPNGPCAV